MREKTLRLLAAVALVIVGLLQLIWIYHTYSLQRRDIKIKVDELLFVAAERELYPRVNEIPPNDTIDIGYELEAGQKITDFVTFQEICSNKYGSDISYADLDSIFNGLLIENNIKTGSSISLVKTDSLSFEELKQENKAFGVIKTDLLPIRKNMTLHIQGIVLNSYKTVFSRIAFLLAATIVMVLFVVYCIILQIRIIIRQNRIAQLRQDFSNAMIHDMKSPLTSITAGVQMLESGKLDNNPKKKSTYIQIMKDEINHLLVLTNKVLTLAKMESGRIALDKQVIQIAPMLNDLIEKFTAKRTKNIKFITYISTENVYADAEYLKEAISNLIDNAIKYSGEHVIIELTCEEKGGFCQIRVKDNGFGISLKDQTLIFEKFERAAATRRSSRGGATGFGLGLNYVQQVVAAHDGTVSIESIEGQYSEFTIGIPQLTEELE